MLDSMGRRAGGASMMVAVGSDEEEEAMTVVEPGGRTTALILVGMAEERRGKVKVEEEGMGGLSSTLEAFSSLAAEMLSKRSIG